jgi:hypothetical protein
MIGSHTQTSKTGSNRPNQPAHPHHPHHSNCPDHPHHPRHSDCVPSWPTLHGWTLHGPSFMDGPLHGPPLVYPVSVPPFDLSPLPPLVSPWPPSLAHCPPRWPMAPLGRVGFTSLWAGEGSTCMRGKCMYASKRGKYVYARELCVREGTTYMQLENWRRNVPKLTFCLG